MTNCCAPGSGFPSASTMENLSTNYPVVWEEICMIQQAILAASSPTGGGQMSTTVGGTTPMTFITGLRSVTVTDGGSGYFIDTPFASIIPPLGGPGMGATATVVTNGSTITAINVTNGGSGYQPISSTLSLSSLTGSGASLQPLVNGSGQINSVNIILGGTGYTTGDSVIATRAVAPSGSYVDAIFAITAVSDTGAILSIQVINPGSGYQDSVAQVNIMSSLNNSDIYPTGSGFIGTIMINTSGVITGITVNNGGAGYSSFLPYLVISDPGTGAITTVNLTGVSVSSVVVTDSGNNYTTSATGQILNPPTANLPNPPSAPAVVSLQIGQNTFGTNPNLYYQVWAGTITNKPIQLQMNAVLSYFTGLGYTITQQSNPITGNTIQWYIAW